MIIFTLQRKYNKALNNRETSLARPEKSLSDARAPQDFIFPADLGSTGNTRYVSFTAIKRTAQDKFEEVGEGVENSVALPIPANLPDNYNYQYADDELGNLLSKDGTNKGAAEIAIKKGISGVQGTFTGASTDGVLRTQFGAANPHLYNNFAGLGFKEHTFTYIMAAKSEAEAVSIRDIIRFFRFHSAPELSESQASFSQPDRFFVKFHPEETEAFLYKPGLCVLSNFSTIFNSNGISAFHVNGAPVDVVLTMTFKEDTIATKNRIAFDYQFDGVKQIPGYKGGS